ncbi:MAG: biotin synthase BioB [Elusimicrobia bacterium]|nr:biotin synthase BioB [Candidatus Obscuribacterium magneticum]
MNNTLANIERKSLANEPLTFDEAYRIVNSTDDELMDWVAVAARVRETFFGKGVKLNFLVNIKSGLCPEDCAYCSQSKLSKAPIEKYPLMNQETIIAHVEKGMSLGATRACLVASGRSPTPHEVEEVGEAVEFLKKKYPQMEICVCLGFLKEGESQALKTSGVDVYNHNINTSESFYEEICETHTYEDRLNTMQKAKEGGLSLCSGVLTGLGESDRDLVMMALTLREKKVGSIPVNFLMAIEKTPMEGIHLLTPQKCLRILALFRLVNPTVELRIAGGREIHLRSLQPLGLMIANSIFIGDYLTTVGQSARKDLEMIRDLGYKVKGQSDDFLERMLERPKSPQIRHSRESGDPVIRHSGESRNPE